MLNKLERNMQASWKTDTELVELVGAGWVEDMDVAAEDFSEAGRVAMLQTANEWLKANGHEERVTDCKDCDDEMSWLVA